MKLKYLFLTLILAFFLSSAITDNDSLKSGDLAPKITLISEDSPEILNLKDSRITLINFWSPKNPASRISNKQFSEFLRVHPETEIDFITICMDSDTNLAQEVINNDGINNSTINLLRNQVADRVFKDYMVEDNYASYLIDKNGKILEINPDTSGLNI